MMYLCQFGWFRQEFYDTCDLENIVEVTKIISLIKVIPMMYMCQFGPPQAIECRQGFLKCYITLLLNLKNRSRPPESFIKIILMMYLCQFGQNLAIGSEDRVQSSFFIKLYDPCDLEN